MALEPIIFTTVGDPAAIVAIAGQQLTSLGYTLTLGDDRWSGEAEVGSKVGRALVGGFVRRMKVSFAVTRGYTEGQWVLTINPGMSGMGGGALGVSKSKKEMASILDSVGAALAQHGHVAPPQGFQAPAVDAAPPAPAAPTPVAPPTPDLPGTRSADGFAPPVPPPPPAGGGNPW